METQENQPLLKAATATYTNLSDDHEGGSVHGLHRIKVAEIFAPEQCGILRPDEMLRDTAPAQQTTSWRQHHRECAPTALPDYEAFFKVTLSDGATLNLLAPNETTWEGDATVQDAVKFIEDPAAELDAFLLAFARSRWCVAVDVLS